MGFSYDEVIINQSEKDEGQSTITINCPDKTGLGCDMCRIILYFGLNIVKADVSTDGKWCYVVFWVVGNKDTRWGLLKERLLEACPSCLSASGISYYGSELQSPKPPDVFLLKLCSFDRKGLLHDVTRVLCDLELTIKKVKVSTTPDARLVYLFFVTDTRELLHTNKRQADTMSQLQDVMGGAMISCEIEMVGPEITACSQESSFLPTSITEDILPNEPPSSLTSWNVSVAMDNRLSPGHTFVQIACQDHKGLLFDIMRTLKDYNIQISNGRFKTKHRGACEVDLFIKQSDGKKIVDLSKQRALALQLKTDLQRPLRVAVVSRSSVTELLVANPVELSGKGRPLVFHDITLALKMLGTYIFSAEIRRRMIGDREFEVYKVLLDEVENTSVPRSKIKEEVWKMLMGWEKC